MWDTRRRILLGSLAYAGSFLIGVSYYASPEKITAISGLTVSIAAFAGPVIAAYMGIAEWGRINGVLGVKTTTSTAVDADTLPPKGEIK
jgi:hypothetical protein